MYNYIREVSEISIVWLYGIICVTGPEKSSLIHTKYTCLFYAMHLLCCISYHNILEVSISRISNNLNWASCSEKKLLNFKWTLKMWLNLCVETIKMSLFSGFCHPGNNHNSVCIASDFLVNSVNYVIEWCTHICIMQCV